MGCFKGMEGGFRTMHKEESVVEFSLPTCSGGGSQKSHALTGCSTPTEQPKQPQISPGVDSGV